MNTPTKNFLKGIATVILIAVNTLGVFVFSFLGSYGIFFAFFDLNTPKLPLIFTIVIISRITIGLILIIPIVRLISQTKQPRWQVASQALLSLFLYLAGGIVLIFCFIFFAAEVIDLSVEERAGTFRILCQVISLSLALGYYFYFKKVIKLRSLKVWIRLSKKLDRG